MRILHYSKTIEFDELPVTFDLVPTQTVTSEHPFFENILSAVIGSDMEYTLIDRREEVAGYRHRT